MSEESSFQDLVQRVRTGDEDAATELVRTYEPHIRRAVRIRLMRNPQMRRVLDSMDVCQSVMGSFFVRAALGQYDLDQPQKLLNLLVVMAHHKLIDVARKKRLPEPSNPDAVVEPAARDDTPSQQIMLRELLQKFREQMTDEERQLADMRAADRKWEDIAAELKANPEALRKKLTRAVERVAQMLGLGPSGEE
jgi:RNA polymerase sigma-70 factor (ECF subfamily)